MTLRLSILLLALVAGCTTKPAVDTAPMPVMIGEPVNTVAVVPSTMPMLSPAAIYNPPLPAPTVDAAVYSGHMTMLVSIKDTNHLSAIGVQSAPTPSGPWLDEIMWPITEQPFTYTVATSRQCWFYRSFVQ